MNFDTTQYSSALANANPLTTEHLADWILKLNLSHQEAEAIRREMPRPSTDLVAYRDRKLYAQVLRNCLAPVSRNTILLFMHNDQKCLLNICGTPVDLVPENTYIADPKLSEVALTAAIQVGLLELLGLSPLSYPFENEGRLFRWVSPTLANMGALSSHGATKKLVLHSDHHQLPIPSVEDNEGCTPMAETLCLAQLYSNLLVPTWFVRYEDVLKAISKTYREEFFRPVWIALPPASVEGIAPREGVPLMVEHNGAIYGRFDAACIKATTRKAQRALVALLKALEDPSLITPITMHRGDLVLWKNPRLLHGRPSFTPRLDGTDRAALRLFGQRPELIRPCHPEVGFLGSVN